MHKVTKDAFTLLIFSTVAGIASYFFFFVMTRLLSVEDYGLLYSINSLMYILTVPQETIRTVVSVFVTKYGSRKGKIHWLMSTYLKRIFLISFLTLLVFLALSPLFAILLHTNFWILFSAGLTLLFAFSLPVIWGIFQGLGKFKELGINNSVEGLIKLGIAVLAVILLPVGYKIYGALIVIPVSMGIVLLIALWHFKDVRKAKKEKIKEKTTRYSIATFFIFGAIALMYSVDVILARYFLTPKLAGIYGGVSLIAKSLFFVATGIKRAMVPNLAETNKTHEKESLKILKKAAVLIGSLFGAAFVLSLFFSEWVVKIVLSSKYLAAAPYLKWMILVFALLSFTNLLVYYNLVTNKNKKTTFRILLVAAFLEIALLIVFHKTLMQFICILLIINAVLLVCIFVISLIKRKEPEPLVLMGSVNILNPGKINPEKGEKERYKNYSHLKKK